MAWGFNIRGALLTAWICCLFLVTAGCANVVRQTNPNIAFMGDSITERWSLPASNLGVSGNITKLMLARFADQTANHGYKAVVILGGTNDVRITSGSLQTQVANAIANIQAMAALAEQENLLPVLCTIPPIQGEESRSAALNAAIRAIAAVNHYKLVDYETPLEGHPEYFMDYLHPNNDGYAVMQTALTKVIALDY